MMSFHEMHSLCAVAVVAHNDCTIISAQPTVVEKVNRQIDVSALLLGSEHLDGALVLDRFDESCMTSPTLSTPQNGPGAASP